MPAEETDAQATPPEEPQLSPVILSDQPERTNPIPIESLSDCTPLAPIEDQNIANPIPEWIEDTRPDALEQERFADVAGDADRPGPAEEIALIMSSKIKKPKKNKKGKKSAGKEVSMSTEQNVVE